MRIVIDRNVSVPMRDGEVLMADVYRPESRARLPTLVIRHPYDRELSIMLNTGFDVLRAVRAGYAVVVQDTRGRWASGGRFDPYRSEAVDGADTVSWAAAQPWSAGKVAMAGVSYFGATQWWAASQSPDSLVAIAPSQTSSSMYEGWTYQGGALQLGFLLFWTLTDLALGELGRRAASGATTEPAYQRLVEAVDSIDTLYRHLPLRDVPVLGDIAPYYADWLDHPVDGPYWAAVAPKEFYEQVSVPALNIGGWHDIFLGGTLENYTGMRRRGATPGARDLQRLIIGPWAHGVFTADYPERSYGLLASGDGFDLTGAQLRWYDHLLKGEANGVDREPRVKFFVMGANEWREADDWPLPGTVYTDYWLHSNGQANSARGTGLLSLTRPGSEPDDVFLYDPRNPVPTVGGQTLLPGTMLVTNAGPRDQQAVEARHDVLCYTSEPLTHPLEVIGPVKLILYVSSSAPDTDFTGKLVDVYPDGRAELVTDGILRARYRESMASPVWLKVGQVYEIEIDLRATATVFRRHHRVRLEVSSSNFPRFDRNTNTGGIIAAEGAADLVPAVNRVHHCAGYPSRLVLPVPAG